MDDELVHEDEHESESEFVVEKILKSRTEKDGTQRFFVKWLGYDTTHNTWEPIESFTDPAIVDDFLATKGGAGASAEKSANKRRERSSLSESGPVAPSRASPKPRGRHKKAKTCQVVAMSRAAVSDVNGDGFPYVFWVDIDGVEMVMSRSQVLKEDPLLLVAFYEKHVKEAD